MTIYVQKLHGNLVEVSICSCGPRGKQLKEWISSTERLPLAEVVLYHNGLLVQEEDQLEASGVYHVSLRLRGGKGGFGSMLRMLGAQIEKTTNHEACRDLSGRRMRDVNNEKKLADWISKKADREREKEEKKEAKFARLRSQPKHYFVDPNYDKQKSQVSESLDEAITQGIYASASVDEPSTSKDKRKLEEEPPSRQSKKIRLWVGVEDDSGSDDSEEEADTPILSKAEELKNPSEPDSASQQPLVDTNKSLCSLEHSTTGDKQDQCSPRISQGTEENQTLVNVAQTIDESDLPTIEEATNQTQVNVAQTTDESDLPTIEEANSSKEGANTSKEITVEFNLEEIETVAALEAFGLDPLKRELISRGLKCGGTLKQRAERLFSVKGLSPEQIDSSLRAKLPKGKKACIK